MVSRRFSSYSESSPYPPCWSQTTKKKKNQQCAHCGSTCPGPHLELLVIACDVTILLLHSIWSVFAILRSDCLTVKKKGTHINVKCHEAPGGSHPAPRLQRISLPASWEAWGSLGSSSGVWLPGHFETTVGLLLEYPRGWRPWQVLTHKTPVLGIFFFLHTRGQRWTPPPLPNSRFFH